MGPCNLFRPVSGSRPVDHIWLCSGMIEVALETAVAKRDADGSRRHLHVLSDDNVDFCSNDYLGFARSRELADAIASAPHGHGSTGSRLVTGTSQLHLDIEADLAGFYGYPSALVFNSGYLANLSVLSAVPQPGDIVLYDELVHNSCREGLRLGRATSVAFRHNDVEDLRARLASAPATGNRIVVVESVYSMDGHIAPLAAMVRLCREYNAALIVDEAHGVAVDGPHGAGVVRALGLEKDVFCTVYTFGKGMGIHGAAVCGPPVLKEYLVNYARPFVYSTSLPASDMVTIRAAHAYCASAAGDSARHQLQSRVRRFRSRVREHAVAIPPASLLQSATAIQGIVCPGNTRVLAAAAHLRAHGFNVVAIRAPTVPVHSERLRIILHAYNTDAEIDALVHHLAAFFLQHPASKL
ncbi:hypothetical protein SPRG_02395 [Saprolegnia parasitica CBS 223.65]|uniref:Aminotransferase class I/classII large domain-containing protein n=1 Tax=Saprolegnia parasitica (strain CBS 223.65) TaxID=695850 RepID=A0A067CTZ5_SAPPC|nr:hypothetical protein SPRG_02395 [Saprolegnia parasitica CBS 223.65]KDO32695.1 hypothetical protein SPRG_02395 [Saprolegnia parasitica CBS 223.65]|eukprot:XP_012196361.1 hypothetical protein SPRG_02395 [Saprolegnia parasitica CBS 223.65]